MGDHLINGPKRARPNFVGAEESLRFLAGTGNAVKGGDEPPPPPFCPPPYAPRSVRDRHAMRLRLVDAAAPRGSVPTEMDARTSGFTGSGKDFHVGGCPDFPGTRVRHLSSSKFNANNRDAAGVVVCLDFCYFRNT